MAADMAQPVTPGQDIEDALDREIKKEPAGLTLFAGDDAKLEAKSEDVEMKDDAQAGPSSKGSQDLDALENALKEASTEDFKGAFYAFGKALLIKYNGALRLLNDACPKGSKAADEFVKDLRNVFPKCTSIAFASGLPGNDVEEFNLHLADLSWFSEASTKPAPYLQLCLSLWDLLICYVCCDYHSMFSMAKIEQQS